MPTPPMVWDCLFSTGDSEIYFILEGIKKSRIYGKF